ncbi:MBOAT family O-acyltransferase [Paenibacillus eucommiae]|uniref:Alginate O-acetyltransferase complex protein AlgI n=1 Tax=Paenibacillus eucommiae TaxID=1355755 RepID=A0ABS4J1K1_9BACL|nr:MBOAT family O-acyltransferase [Paenibacillus eucommiae]MBP1992684.1 alginate O-acetyltransferase complex protein AlgI [Paenibacillus eucommiae]
MFYLNMNAIMAMLGMVVILMLTRRYPNNKRVLTLLFSVCFLLLFSKKLLVFYLIFTLLNYLGFVYLCRTKLWRTATFLFAILANVAAVFIGIRFFVMGIFQNPLFDTIIYLGLIYNVLKVIDAYYFAYFFEKKGQVPLLDYSNYILFIPTFTSGPILKFRDFMADSKKPYTVNAALFEDSIKRIVLGLFKKIVLVTWMTGVFNDVLQNDLHTHQSIFLMIWFYALIYFDFSGYSDIAIGFGRLMGYTMPENFKRPFLSPTLTQYWRNWHATLGDFFRDHIFMFFSRKTPSRLTAAGLSLLIMVLIGLWHGFSWLYLLWGVYHGLLLALENLFQLSTVNKKKSSKTYFYFRCFCTQALVTLAVIIYSPDHEAVLRIYRGLLNLPSF